MIVVDVAAGFLPLRSELPPAETMQVEVEDGLPGIVARVAGEAVAGRLDSHLAGDPSGYRDQATEGRLVFRVGLPCRGKMLFRDDEEVDGRLPPRLVLRNVEGDHEVILVQHLRPNRAVNDPTEQALGQVTPPDVERRNWTAGRRDRETVNPAGIVAASVSQARRHAWSPGGGAAVVTAPRNAR